MNPRRDNNYKYIQFSTVHLLSHVRHFVTPWSTAHQAFLPITNCRRLPKPMFIESVMPSNRLILCRPLLLLPSIFPSIRVFSNESSLCIRWPKYWSFSFSISPSKEIPWLISFRMDWLDLLAVQGTLKSLLQHHSSKASLLQRSAFFTVQLSHPYMIRLPCTLNWLRNVKTNNVITLALLNMWQHFRNLELHLATSKEFNNSFPHCTLRNKLQGLGEESHCQDN